MDRKQTKRLRVSKACTPCRTSKRRCDGNSPCDQCASRKLACIAHSQASRSEPVATPDENEPFSEQASTCLDLPAGAEHVATTLIDQYFDVIAPIWPVVFREDLNIRPFAPPLLTRSICLIAATYASRDQLNDPLVSDILESVKQCFDEFELLSMPSLWCLQSLLLLAMCPRVPQSPMLVASACRMALILGLHRRQTLRPTLYWACIAAARWESLKRPSCRATQRPCIDLVGGAPASEPDNSSPFGLLYNVLAEADQARSSVSTDAYFGSDFYGLVNQPGLGMDDLPELLELTRKFVSGKGDGNGLIQATNRNALNGRRLSNLNPFFYILRGGENGLI